MKKTRLFNSLIIAFLLLHLTGCKTPTDVDFSFSPLQPRAGEKVTFTNTTKNGSIFDWRFGDGNTSNSNSPVHIYTKPGKYTVTLRVDSSNNYIRIKDIEILDTIPFITLSTGYVGIFTNVTFSASAYNPQNLAVTYEWTFSNNAVGETIINNISTAKDVTLYFTTKNVTENVKLKITIGDKVYNITSSVFVNDVKAKTLIMAKKGGNLLEQRLYENGIESPVDLGITSGKHPFNLAVYPPNLYIFDAGTLFTGTALAGDGTIRKMDVTNKTVTEMIKNTGSNEFNFYNGWADNANVYWTDYTQYVRKAANTTTGASFNGTDNTYYLAKTTRLGYYGNGFSDAEISGGVTYYDNTYFWAKKGLFRFKATDILAADVVGTGTPPSIGAVLTDYYISAFTIDHINQKIYFAVYAPADKTGFWAANLDGTSAVRIDDAPITANREQYITGIAVDNNLNKVYWAYRSPETVGAASPSGTWADYYALHPTHRTGVKRTNLIVSTAQPGAIDYLLPNVAVYGLAISSYFK